MRKIALSLVVLMCLSARADYTISHDVVHSGQVEGSHNNGGHEHVIWNITVPAGVVAHVSVFGTMSSAACSSKNAYLIFTGDSEEHHFGGYVDGKTYSATFEKSSKVTIYANAKPGEYSELVPVVNPITGSVTYTHRYVTYSAYTCTLKYEITVTYKSLAKHTVKYLPGTNGSGAERSQQKTVGVDLELLGAVFSRSGYSQVGWSLRSDGSTLDYSLGETYARDDDLTLYPYWQKGSAAAVPVSLAVNGGASISPGSSLNLTGRVKYTDGSSRLVTPKWLISAGVNNATISSDGVLSVKASATGSVTVKAIFVEGEVFVVNTLKIKIKSDSSRIVTVVPSGGGYAVSEDFDTGDTYAWYFDVSKCPNWVTSPMVAIASGTFKGSAYDLTYYWTKPIEEARNKRCNLVDTAHFSIRASENDTAQERSWTVPAKDNLGNVLKTFIFVQKASNAESSFWLSVTGESQVKTGHQSLYVCEAIFSNGSATLVQPTWSVSADNTAASISSDGVLTVGKVTEKTRVTLSARLSCDGKTEIATKTVTILPQESVPASPSDVIASDGTFSEGVLVSWTKAANATYYDLYRSTSSTRPSSPTWTGVTSPYSDTTAETGVTYYYWVSAVNSAGSTISSCDTGYRAAPVVTTYAVTYEPGAHASGSTLTATKTEDVSLTLKGATFTRTGYTQTGWSTDYYGSAKSYSLSGSYTSNSGTTLYPYWTANTCSISYALNGGSHGSTHPTSATFDSAFYVSAPSRSGYTFAGWTVTSGLDTSTAKWGTSSSPSAPISSSSTKCVNGASSVCFKNLTATSDGRVTLTANWEDVPLSDFEISDGVLTKYKGAGGAVTIPPGVTCIGEGAFKDCYGLMSVTMPSGVTSIGNFVFCGCSGLTSVTIPSSVTSIGDGAFRDCSGLTSVYVDKGDADRVRTMLEDSGFDCANVMFVEGEPTPTPVPNGCTVSFNANGGSCSTSSKQCASGTTLGTLPTATRAGYEFLGWFTAASGGTQVTAATVVTEDVTFYAQWWKIAILPVGGDPAIACEIAAEYRTKADVGVISVKVVNVDEAVKIAVKGLPNGVRFAAKDIVDRKTKEVSVPANSIYGTPTKSGVYAATITVTPTDRKSKMAPLVKTLTFVVRNAGEHVVRVDCDAAQGFVKGMGVYASGKKVTLKATAAKGWVFAGWYNGEALVSSLASYALTMPEKDVNLTARFISVAEDRAAIRLAVDGKSFVGEGGETPPPLNVEVRVGMYVEWPVAASALSATTVKVSGLPSGLKFTAKDVKATKMSAAVPANTIYGTPKTASKVDKDGKVTPSKVKITVMTAGKSKQEYVLNMPVRGIPAEGTFNGGGENGLVTLTVAKTGKLSGKYLADGKTWTLSAAGFDTWDDDDRMTATLTAKSGKEVETLALVYEAGRVCASLTSGGDAASPLFEAWRNEWKTGPQKSLATKLKGQKVTVGENGNIVLTVGANGAVTAKGAFVTGFDEKKQKDVTYSASCSTVLIPTEFEGRYVVYLYFPPKAGKFEGFSGMVEIGLDND